MSQIPFPDGIAVPQLLTDHGSISVSELSGASINVLAADGRFHPASVRSVGIKPTQLITFRTQHRSNHRLVVQAPCDHRWIVEDRLMTRSLAINDLIPTQTSSEKRDEAQYALGFVHGLIFGDGTRHTYYPTRFMIRLCGDKSRYRAALESHPCYRSTSTVGGDAFITIVTSVNQKVVPPADSSTSYTAGFIEGWIATDGHTAQSGSKFVDTISISGSNWLVGHAGYAGFVPVGHCVNSAPTNFGPRTAPLHRLALSIRPEVFVVESIRVDEPREAFAVHEPATRSVVLAGGLLTSDGPL